MIAAGITDTPKKHSKANIPRMNDAENAQLLHKVSLLEVFLRDNNNNQYTDRYKRSGEYKKGGRSTLQCPRSTLYNMHGV